MYLLPLLHSHRTLSVRQGGAALESYPQILSGILLQLLLSDVVLLPFCNAEGLKEFVVKRSAKFNQGLALSEHPHDLIIARQALQMALFMLYRASYLFSSLPGFMRTLFQEFVCKYLLRYILFHGKVIKMCLQLSNSRQN